MDKERELHEDPHERVETRTQSVRWSYLHSICIGYDNHGARHPLLNNIFGLLCGHDDCWRIKRLTFELDKRIHHMLLLKDGLGYRCNLKIIVDWKAGRLAPPLPRNTFTVEYRRAMGSSWSAPATMSTWTKLSLSPPSTETTRARRPVGAWNG